MFYWGFWLHENVSRRVTEPKLSYFHFIYLAVETSYIKRIDVKYVVRSWPLGTLSVTTLTFQGHLTSSVTLAFDSKVAISYRFSIATKSVSPAVIISTLTSTLPTKSTDMMSTSMRMPTIHSCMYIAIAATRLQLLHGSNSASLTLVTGCPRTVWSSTRIRQGCSGLVQNTASHFWGVVEQADGLGLTLSLPASTSVFSVSRSRRTLVSTST